jgi:Na+-driven multidrug efflux pump
MIVAVVMFIGAALIFTLLPEKLISLDIADGTSASTAAITLSHGVNYLRIMVVGLLPFAITQSYAGTLRELGETKLPMLSSIAAILINLVFNYFLIFGCHISI